MGKGGVGATDEGRSGTGWKLSSPLIVSVRNLKIVRSARSPRVSCAKLLLRWRLVVSTVVERSERGEKEEVRERLMGGGSAKTLADHPG